MTRLRYGVVVASLLIAQAVYADPVTVELASVTLGEDCGGVANAGGAVDSTAMKRDASTQKGKARGASACQQTSMQLSIAAAEGATPTSIEVKRVELFDEAGATLGVLTPRAPTVWRAGGGYHEWDQKIGSNQTLAVSYALSAPSWGAVKNRYNQVFVLKAVVTVGTKDQRLQRNVELSAPTIMPPNVKT